MSKKIHGFIRLMRPVNCVMIGFAVIVGVVFANTRVSGVFLPYLIYGFITGFTLTAASMAINDYYDREIDAINEPNRSIPSGLIEPKEALVFAFILTLVGFIYAYLTSVYCFVIAVLAWIFFVAYTTVGKNSGLPGNFLVSTCVSVPFIYGSVIISDAIELNVLILALMAFFSNTGREITKGIVDVRGDKARDVKTLAVRYGEGNAAITATFFYLLAVLLSPLPWLLNIVSIWFIPLVALTDFGLLASSYMLIKDWSRENARKIKKNVLLFFIVGLLAFVIGQMTI